MTPLEIILLLIGIICFALSFVFSSIIDGPVKANVNTDLSDKQKADIKKQIAKVFDDEMDEMTEQIMESISEKTEIALERMSNQKIKELSEYSETVLSDINKTHTEVMFLYDMLNEKDKEIHNTIRDFDAARARENTERNVEKYDYTFAEQIPNIEKDENRNLQAETLSSILKNNKEKIEILELDDIYEEENNTSEEISEEEENISKNEAILRLYEQGLSDVEIAKELSMGIGEVKLVKDLFKGQNK